MANPEEHTSQEVRVKRGERQRRLLSEAVQIEEELMPAFARPLLYLVAVMVILFLIWSAMVEISEVAVAPGEVVPSGRIKVVQHLFGGRVAAIQVESGQLVDKGTVMVRLDGGEAVATLQEREARVVSLRLREERLTAILDDRAPRLAEIGRGYPDMVARLAEIGRGYPDMVARQREIYRNRLDSHAAGTRVLNSRLAQKEDEIESLTEQIGMAQRELALANELLDLRRTLERKGLVSRVQRLESQQQAVAAETKVRTLRQDLKAAREAATEIRDQRADSQAKLREAAADELGQVSTELAEMRGRLQDARQRAARLSIQAPERGVVQDLQLSGVGEVVEPGGMIARIVPVDDTLEAEVRINPKDVGHVKAGQSVEVKITGYDYRRFGGVEGTLARVSASRLLDEEGNPYFEGVVTFDRNYVGDVPGENVILPGMSVDADILTGTKTLLGYLLNPVIGAIDTAFTER